MSAPSRSLNAALDDRWAEHAYPGGDEGPQADPLNQRRQNVKQDQPTYRNIDEPVQDPEREI